MRYEPISLDALTDILSNVVGISIIFCLLTVLQSSARLGERNTSVELFTTKTPRFFVISDSRLAEIDLGQTERLVFLGARAQGLTTDQPLPLDGSGLALQFADDGRLSFLVVDSDAWPKVADVVEDTRAGVFADFDPSRHFAFLFVSAKVESLESLVALRRALRDRGIESGWRPIDEQNPTVLCGFGNLRSRCKVFPLPYDRGS